MGVGGRLVRRVSEGREGYPNRSEEFRKRDRARNARRFVEKLDFLTTPGYLTGPGAREEAGLPKDAGPYKVITDLAVMGFDARTKRMQVESLHPDVAFETVRENTAFEIGRADRVGQTEPPHEDELRILREQVDPYGYIIGR